MAVQILADSASDLTQEHYDTYNIQMVPLTVHLDGDDFLDGIDMQPKQVYDSMRAGSSPKTSQVSPQAFYNLFSTYAKEGTPLVYVAFSSELSGTYQTAKMMEQEVKEQFPEAVLHVIDSKCASIGYGLVILHIAQLAQDGASVDEIVEQAQEHATHMEHIFTVDDLEYLYRGGRVSKTAAFVGSLLKIKPILHVEDGKLIPLEKIRGSKRVLSRMVALMEERGIDIEQQTIGISHGDDLEKAEALAAKIKEQWNPKEIIIEYVGSVIGAHSGPGTLALFFLNKPKE